MKLLRIRMLLHFTDGNVIVKSPEKPVKIGARTKIGYSILLFGAWIIFGHSKQFQTITYPQDNDEMQSMEERKKADQTLAFTQEELFKMQEMMREARANPIHPGDYQDRGTADLINRIVDALNESYEGMRHP